MAMVNPKPMSVFEKKVDIRVRYQETDGQRRLHHSNYLNYFEIGRVELLRENGISYKELEDQRLHSSRRRNASANTFYRPTMTTF